MVCSRSRPKRKRKIKGLRKTANRTKKTKFDKGDRKAYITQERIDRLNAIGFVWDPNEQAWAERYDELQTYKNEHGNCNVPQGWPENKQLDLWVSAQRKQKTEFDNGGRKANAITQERTRRQG